MTQLCDYSITIDTASCIGDPPIVEITGLTSVCYDRSIDLTATNIAPGQSSGNTYSWVGPNGFTATTQTINHYDPVGGSGIYSVTITNTDGCTATAQVTVAIFDELLLTFNSATAESSPGAGDGTIQVTPSGGAAPYLMSDDFGNLSFDGNFVGPYVSGSQITITVLDANSCQTNLIVNIP